MATSIAVAVSAHTSQDTLMRVADRYRRSVMRLLIEPIERARASIDLVTLESLLSFGHASSVLQYLEKAIDTTTINFRVAQRSKMSDLILRIHASAGNATRCDFTAECLQAFDVTNPEAVTFAEAHAAELVVQVSTETRSAVNSIVQRMFNENITPKSGASLIKKVVGLTESSANAVVNLHQKILTSKGNLIYAGKTPIRVPKNGMDASQLDRTLTRYADRLTRQRAMNIARTETIKASNEGQMILWKQAQSRGELPKTLKHEWIASFSERTCPICSGMNGEIVVIGQQFSSGHTSPPAHPMCRCSTGIVL